jgi:hypothetical protein
MGANELGDIGSWLLQGVPGAAFAALALIAAKVYRQITNDVTESTKTQIGRLETEFLKYRERAESDRIHLVEEVRRLEKRLIDQGVSLAACRAESRDHQAVAMRQEIQIDRLETEIATLRSVGR